MFKYLRNGKHHTDTTKAYMDSLKLDAETQESILAQQQFELEQKAIIIRKQRDKLVRETDFYLLPDAPTSPEGLLEYRQALRDVPQQAGFPYDVEWPVLW